jgi:hypothetical protein
MGNENHENRSSAFSPEQLAQITMMNNAMIKEAVGAVFQSLGPVLQSIAVTPEKLREANKPYVDPAVTARQEREKMLWRQDIEDGRKNLEEMQKNCLHQDDNGRTCISLIHNWPDRQPRGICMHCQCLINPREWVIGPPDAKNPRGRAYLRDAHPLYTVVRQLQARN